VSAVQLQEEAARYAARLGFDLERAEAELGTVQSHAPAPAPATATPEEKRARLHALMLEVYGSDGRRPRCRAR
jgi:hypothetical protein